MYRTFSTFVSFILAVFMGAGCSTDQDEADAEVVITQTVTESAPSDEAALPLHAAQQESTAQAVSLAASMANDTQDGHCIGLKDHRQPPFFVKKQNLMVTRIVGDCLLSDGEPGYAANGSFMAMGFPCTGGAGQVSWAGHHYKPQMLSFVVSNNCPMKPASAAQAKTLLEDIGIRPEMQIKAYYPFSTQYWELVDYNESGTGHIIEVRNGQNVPTVWRAFREKKPVRVRLYGRENAWVKSKKIYRVEAEVVMANQSGFVLNILSVLPLNDSGKMQAKLRCEALGISRHCAEIFAL